MRRAALSALLWLALPALPAWSQESLLAVRVESGSALWVGQRLSVFLTLKSPGYFASAASFDLPDPEGVLLMPPTQGPVVGSETIGGVMYSTQLHEFRAWPMHPGAVTIPPIAARFSYKAGPLEDNEIPVALTSEAIPIRVEQPPGTAGMGTLISARGLSVEERWEPAPDATTLEAGAALTRSITFTAPDMPGMLFPPFPVDEIEGVGIYSNPRLADRQERRGGFVGQRREEITYLFKRPGQFTLPAVQFRWFDLDSGAVRSESFEAQTFEILPNPALASGPVSTPAGATSGPDWRRLTIGVLVGTLVLTTLAWLWKRSAGTGRVGEIFNSLRPVRLQPLNPPKGDGESVGKWRGEPGA